MKILVTLLILTLCVLHHDLWWWDTPGPVAADATDAERNKGILFGFLPIGLAWHTFISLAAGAVWLLAVKTCWPKMLDADEGGAA